MASGSGLVITAGNSVIRGLGIVNFPGNGIELLGSGGYTIEGNVIGTDAAGTADLGNGGAGVLIDASDNIIGGAVKPDGSFLQRIGEPGTGDGQLGIFPRGLDFDPVSGHLFLADGSNHRIQRFDTDGNFILKWGRNGGDGTSGTGNGELNQPMGVALDVAGKVYISDSSNHRIQKFDGNGDFLLKWGAGGGDGTSGAGPGEFNRPWGIATGFDGATEVVYVLDRSNHRVEKFDTNGTFLLEWGSRGAAPGQFESARGIAVDATGFVYVADRSNQRVQKFDSSGGFIRAWGSLGVGQGEFEGPNELAFDSVGRLYVTDLGNDRFQVFDSDGNFIAVRGVSGEGPGEFIQTTGITLDADDNVYVLQGWNPDIQKFAPLFNGVSELPNVVAFNDQAGVRVAGGTGNAILSNQIYDSPQSIDLPPVGPDPLGPGVPELSASSSIVDFGFAKVTGSLNNTPDAIFNLDFFFSSSCNPTSGGEGAVFMGSAEVMTDALGVANFAASLPFDTTVAGFASATATDPGGNTTEFSECIAHTVAPRLSITNHLSPRLPNANPGNPYSESFGGNRRHGLRRVAAAPGGGRGFLDRRWTHPQRHRRDQRGDNG